MSAATDTIKLAHTARCKLQLAADRPDRNLRFILGHAFTLDKLRLRIAEIEEDDSVEDTPAQPITSQERRVSFQSHGPRASTLGQRRSPPPNEMAQLYDEESESDEDEDVEIDDEKDDGLSLRRFASGSVKPPQMIDDDSSEEEDAAEPKSPPPLSNEELESLTGGPGDVKLTNAYQQISRCPCHGEHGPSVSQIWEVPRREGEEGPRIAVIEVAA